METIRTVGLWYYFLTSLLFICSLYVVGKHKLLRFGALLLGIGGLFNGLWEVSLFTLWSRTYESPVSIPLQSVYHSLTEFGPLLVLLVFVFHYFGVISLDGYIDKTPTRGHSMLIIVSKVLLAVWSVILVGILVIQPAAISLPVVVTRDLNLWFFVAEVGLAGFVISTAWLTNDKDALLLFGLVGLLNTLVELTGLWLGFRLYTEIPSIAAVAIGFGEGGSAAALTWMIATRLYQMRIVE